MTQGNYKMENEKKTTPTETVSLAAQEAARIVQVAVDEAKRMVEKATVVAADVVNKEHGHEEKLTHIVSLALREVFGEQEEQQRFIDTKRIPLICKDISNINKSLDELHTKIDNKYVSKERFEPVEQKVENISGNVTWLVRLIIGAIVLALLGLVLVVKQ